MKDILQTKLDKILTDLGATDVSAVVTQTTDLKHGDYTSNAPLVLAKVLKRNPLDIANEIKKRLEEKKAAARQARPDQFTEQSDQKASELEIKSRELQDIGQIEVAPPGFLNFHLSASTLSRQVTEVLRTKEAFGSNKSQSQKKVIVEFAHPNTHKAFHIGHLRNITTGETIVRLLESQGTQVVRVNYQGDVGMHIAKCLYGILESQKSKVKSQNFIDEHKNKLPKERAEFLGQVYAIGSQAFESSDEAKEKIKEINKKIYDKSDAEINQLYQETRQWSLDYFDTIYRRVGSHFDRLYFESEFAESGTKLAKEAVTKGILTESDGAIVFVGKPYGLDTRVFINSLGLPTYEGKELGLAQKELTDFGRPDEVIHVVGPEQASFFKVTFKVEELLGLQKNQQRHLVYGWVKLKKGKMSSRTGNVILGEWLLDELKKAILTILQTNKSNYSKEQQEEIAEKAAVAAAKYAFLRVGTNQEIAFDIEESVNINGDSGPYLQYTYARARSVLRKAGDQIIDQGLKTTEQLNDEERYVLRQIYRFPETITEAAQTSAPSTLAAYLYHLASLFNTFYNKHPILGSQDGQGMTSEKKELRLVLTVATAQVLKNGLYLLGIETLEQM